MPLVTNGPEGVSFRLNYLFNRIEISHDDRASWTIFFGNDTDSLGKLFGLTVHRNQLFVVSDSGIHAFDLESPVAQQICPPRKDAPFVDIESFDNMLYACTNSAIYQASSGSRWRLKYDGSLCGQFFSLLTFQNKLFAATEKGVYVSSQEARFWHPRFVSKDFGRFLALDAKETMLYAQTDKGYLVSDDSGQHWQPYTGLAGPWTAAMGGTMLFSPKPTQRQNKANSGIKAKH